MLYPAGLHFVSLATLTQMINILVILPNIGNSLQNLQFDAKQATKNFCSWMNNVIWVFSKHIHSQRYFL